LNSFIFSLNNLKKKPLKISWSENFSICCNLRYGPVFGGLIYKDLEIADRSNTNEKSYSNLGISYIHPEYQYGTDEAESFLAGSRNFQVSEIEVYTR
jgi:hypothetical protein